MSAEILTPTKITKGYFTYQAVKLYNGTVGWKAKALSLERVYRDMWNGYVLELPEVIDRYTLECELDGRPVVDFTRCFANVFDTNVLENIQFDVNKTYTLDLSNVDFSNAYDMHQAFSGICVDNIKFGKLPRGRREGTTFDLSYAFHMSAVEHIDLSGMDIKGRINMQKAFSRAARLRGITWWNNEDTIVYDMTSSFSGCISLEQLDMGMIELIADNPYGHYWTGALSDCYRLRKLILPRTYCSEGAKANLSHTAIAECRALKLLDIRHTIFYGEVFLEDLVPAGGLVGVCKGERLNTKKGAVVDVADDAEAMRLIDRIRKMGKLEDSTENIVIRVRDTGVMQ